MYKRQAHKTYKRLIEKFLWMLCENRAYFGDEVARNSGQAKAWRQLAEKLIESGNTMIVKQFEIDRSRFNKLVFLLSDDGIVLSDVGKVKCNQKKRIEKTDEQIADLCKWYENEVEPTAS